MELQLASTARRPGGGPRGHRGPWVLVLAALGTTLVACHPPDPRQELDISGIETYWVIDAPPGGQPRPPQVGDVQYLAPAIRFTVRNKGQQTRPTIEAQAVFRRQGDAPRQTALNTQVTDDWGSDWQRVTPQGKPLAPGQSVVVVLRSNSHYTSTGTPAAMLRHELFRDASVKVFLRVGASNWVIFADQGVERRIGARSVQEGAS